MSLIVLIHYMHYVHILHRFLMIKKMARLWVYLCVCIFSAGCLVSGRNFREKRSASPYIEYQPGTLNVIISAPHGGVQSPASIPDRTPGCWDGERCVFKHGCGTTDSSRCPVSTVTDGYTKTLAGIVSDELERLIGKAPFRVTNLLRRRKMDANREKEVATLGVREAEDAWDAYQEYIDTAKAAIPGRGLFVDIHGHGHTTQWTELGYRISKSRLNSGDLSATYSSIKHLNAVSEAGLEELVRGTTSLGGFLADAGYRAVPSPQDPSPGSEPYFSGGYLTKTHGSRDGGEIDAIQVEAPSGVRFNSTKRSLYGKALAAAIKRFLEEHYAE